jgi:hypothetical protein
VKRLPLLLAAAPLLLGACGLSASTAAPRCTNPERTALVAQSVPTAAYVPCLQPLEQGWQAVGFEARSGSSRLSLLSDRSGGRRVDVHLQRGCAVDGATAEPARAEGVRSYLRVQSVSPTYAGERYDVFPGGCVRTRFDLPRGPHIPLLEELATSVDLVRRTELAAELRERLGVELDP